MSDLTLPTELCECELSLKEIGAIFILYSLKSIDEDSQSHWSTDEDMVKTGRDLVERGIIKFSKNDDDENIMEIDITSLPTLKKDFWEVYDYTSYGNVIYAHISNYGDDDSMYYYKLFPRLEDDKIVYSLTHSEFGEIAGCVTSLKEGEEFVKLELEKDLLQIKLENLNKSNGQGR